jgi:DNA-directed RNA polymerase specialized sigma subunit
MNRKHRHVHLGERLDAIERIRAGEATPEEVAAEFEVPAEEVHQWMQVHREDRIVSLDETRVQPEVRRLSRRAERLVALIATADTTIRVLNRMLAEASAGRSPTPEG